MTPWGLVLVGSAATLLIAGAVLGALWLSSTETRTRLLASAGLAGGD